MHPVAWNRYLSVAKAKFPPLPHPPTNSAKRKDELSTRYSQRETQRPTAFICAAQLRSSVCSDTTPSRLPLLPFSLPPLRFSETDSCRERHSAACNPKPQAHTSVWIPLFTVSTGTFLLEITNQSRKNPKDRDPVPSSGFLNNLHLPVQTQMLHFCCTGLCCLPVPRVMYECWFTRENF